jgi:tetratricopeptide (TPR) repeat protein
MKVLYSSLNKPCMKNSLFYILLLMMLLAISCNQTPSDQDGGVAQSESKIERPEDITKLIMQDSGNAILYDRRAKLYLKQKEHNLAMRDMLAAIQLDPDNPDFMLGLSDIYLSMGLLDNCRESLDRALKLDPENVESMLKLAELNLMLRDYKAAIVNADKAIEIDKLNPLPHLIKGYTYAFAGDTVLAIKSYLEAVNIDQDYYDAYIQLGLIYSVAGNKLAIDYFNNALNTNPQSVEALYALGMFYQEKEEVDNAIASYNRLLVIDPQNVYAIYNLGFINLVYLGDYEQAINYFGQAADLKPDYFEAIYNQGYAYELSGDYETARRLYNIVLEIEVNYDKAIAGLNRIYGK